MNVVVPLLEWLRVEKLLELRKAPHVGVKQGLAVDVEHADCHFVLENVWDLIAGDGVIVAHVHTHEPRTLNSILVMTSLLR